MSIEQPPAIIQQIDQEALLWAIAAVESGGDPKAVCSDGTCLGLYQFTESTWELCSDVPFQAATIREYADSAARVYLAQLIERLTSSGHPADVHNLAVSWNAGPGAVIKGNATRATVDYALRVGNLYDRKLKEKIKGER